MTEVATSEFDFSDADLVPPGQFNKVLWEALMSGRPCPARRASSVVQSVEEAEQ
jgi:hypothetical protein